VNQTDQTCECAEHRKVTAWITCKRFSQLLADGVIDETGRLLRPDLLNVREQEDRG
jgi:hypothetical protein